jgi:hypothetical protein
MSNQTNIRKLAEEEAMLTILSDGGGLTTEAILDSLFNGIIPEEVSVWQPFEHCDADALLQFWDGFKWQFEQFGKRVTNA